MVGLSCKENLHQQDTTQLTTISGEFPYEIKVLFPNGLDRSLPNLRDKKDHSCNDTFSNLKHCFQKSIGNIRLYGWFSPDFLMSRCNGIHYLTNVFSAIKLYDFFCAWKLDKLKTVSLIY